VLDLEEVSDRGLDLLWKVSAGHHLRVAEKYVRGEAMMCLSRKRFRLSGLRLESLANLTLEQVPSADVLLVCRGYTGMSTVMVE
jgi:hypothetical protein